MSPAYPQTPAAWRAPNLAGTPADPNKSPKEGN